ncbi:MAG: serine/threonine protein kinase, partial [Myxococcota bacterium]
MSAAGSSASELDELKARVGKSFAGKWKVDRLIGSGGTAAVYAATHESGRHDALKILHPEFVEAFDVAARFRREAN